MRGCAVVLVATLCETVASCASAPERVPSFATARVAGDFDTYELRRVGLLPVGGPVVDASDAEALGIGLYSEISRTTPFEVVALGAADLAEVDPSEPHRRGVWQPRTVIDVSRRFDLDGILFATVTRRQMHPPQRISAQMDLVSSETGLVIWSSSVHLDADDAAVLDGLETWAGEEASDLALLSPARFSHFAAWQLASLL